VWKIDTCYRCAGKDDKCHECKGSNVIRIDRCPRAIASESEWVFDLLPFFFDWYASAAGTGVIVWPDGQTRYYQPRRLQLAFDVLYEEYLACRKKPD
jgi:hypothetical protein